MGSPSGPPQVVVPGAGWVDVASRAIVQVGFPVVVAGVLLWFLLTRFQTNMDAITSRMERNATAVSDFVEHLEAQTAELRLQTQELKLQTAAMGEQARLMHKIAADSSTLVELRKQEVTLFQQLEARGREKP